MAQPDLLAVDELSLGLAPMVVDDLAEHLVRLNRERGMSVLLVEQNARLALELCPRAYVLEAGRIALSGSRAELADSPAVQAAYFGAAPDEIASFAASASAWSSGGAAGPFTAAGFFSARPLKESINSHHGSG